MECRYFDAHGNYYLKDNEDVQDTWLEGVDWNKVSIYIYVLCFVSTEDSYKLRIHDRPPCSECEAMYTGLKLFWFLLIIWLKSGDLLMKIYPDEEKWEN